MMSAPIPSKARTLSFDNSHPNSAEASPQILTPTGTPPLYPGAAAGVTESRLRQLLANFDAGTHSFCREDRETAAERNMSFVDVDAPKQQQATRRPSFLSSLSLSRPLPFPSSNPSSTTTPAQTPISTSFSYHLGSGFSTTPANSPRPALTKEQGAQSHSTPSIPTAMMAENGPSLARSKTSLVVKQKGFDLSMAQNQQHVAEVKRHFDPSKEPRLFGLL